jgi:acetyl esterase/lipase
MPVNPNSIHPNPVRDIGKAFLTIRTYADAWLVDMDKIAICGFSAGGHNCAMYSVYWDKPLITEHFNEGAAKFRPAAVILGYALSDYHLTVKQEHDNEIAAGIRRAAAIALLGTAEPNEALLTEVSPARHISDTTPPTFIWATVADALVPAEHSTRLATALAAAGVPFEIHLFEEGQHGLSLANEATAGSQLDIDVNAAQWVQLAEAWLKKRFTPSLPAQPLWMQELEAKRNLA